LYDLVEARVLDDLKSLEGIWQPVSFDCPGRQPYVPTFLLHISGNEFTVMVGEHWLTGGTIHIDASKPLKEIDFSYRVQGEAIEVSHLAVYRLDGEELTICMPDPGQHRPTEFFTGRGTTQCITVYRRGR
jgi:uncharacterized protein (TIGR03067 family)